MKKLFVLCSLVLCFLLGSVNVFAADTKNDEKSSTKITVSFKSGTDSYLVNDKTVKAEASALVQGNVFVPVNVVTDALNANLDVDLKKKTAIINYSGVEIKLTDKKKEAIIADKKVKTDVAPFIKKSSFMVSISFLADTLGADISNTNGQVTFVKEIANPNSIKDFSTLIKKTTKNKVGDSYYNWSMLLPSELKLEYRDFTGKENYFMTQDESYTVDVYFYEQDKDSSLDNSINYMLNFTKDYTLIDYETKSNNDGINYVEFIYKDDKQTYQYRNYLLNNMEYNFLITTQNENSYLDDKYQNIIDSFQFNFSKDGSTEDLSDVSKDGYRKYQDNRLKWSINMHPDWEEIKDNKIQNKIIFTGKDKAYFSVEVYSLDKSETLDSITEEAIKRDSEDLNMKLYNVTKQESAFIGGVKCNKLYYTVQILDKKIFGCEIYFTDKNYKYILSSELSGKDYCDSKQKKLVDGIISSFKFTELNAKTIGKLLDPEKVILTKKTRNISSDLFSMDIPFNWIDSEDNSKTFENYFLNSANVSVVTYDDIDSISDFISYLDTTFAKKTDKNFKVESKTILTEKGTTCYKYSIIYNANDIEYKEDLYLLQNGSKILGVDFVIKNLNYGTENIKIFNEIWNSFTLK